MTQAELKELRQSLGLKDFECAEKVYVTRLTWQRWEGQTSKTGIIPRAQEELFLLKVGLHPDYKLVKKNKS